MDSRLRGNDAHLMAVGLRVCQYQTYRSTPSRHRVVALFNLNRVLYAFRKNTRRPVSRQNLTPYRRFSYYKLECVECESIIGVKWEKPYYGYFTRRHSAPQAQLCPLCEHKTLKWFKIRAEDFAEINKTWDLAELSADKPENLDDWHSWLV